MFKFINILFFLFVTAPVLRAQHTTKPATSRTHKGRQNTASYNRQPQASPGKTLTFNDALLLSGIPENREEILAQKGFKAIKQKQPDADAYMQTDTFLYSNTAGEQLCFFYSNYNGSFLREIIFRTPAQARARQLLADAFKQGYTAIDSTVNATGNDEESFLVHTLKYGIPMAKTVSPAYDAYQNFFTTSETYRKTTKLFAFHFSRELRQEPALIDPGYTTSSPGEPGPPMLYKPGIKEKVADTLVIGTGRPVLLFVETGLAITRYNDKDQDPDSLAFFKKRNFFYGSFLRLKESYPQDQYRYINMYKPTVIRFDNSKKETLYYLPRKGYSEFVYWSGKTADPLQKHRDWQDAEYIVSNATGDNQLKKDYKNFVADSLTVARIKSLPTGQPSAQVLQGMNQFIAKAVWNDDLLYFPQLDLKQVRRITASSNGFNAQYYFNRNGQLDSLTNEQSKGQSYSYTVSKVQYKDNVPFATYSRYDTVYFKYTGDTLITLQDGRIVRYRLHDSLFIPIDKFKTFADKYLRNNIRDYTNDNDFISLQPSLKKDADGAPLVEGESDYRGIQSKYIFRKGQLQQIRVTGRNTAIRYFVFIEKYP